MVQEETIKKVERVTTSVLDVEVSCFANYNEPANPKTVNLLSFLTSEKYKDEVLAIRGMENKEERDRRKALLPAITPSGVFASYREAKNLISHSGFIQFDIDHKENSHIGNYNSIKKQLSHIKEVCYCGLSVSGKGYWGLVRIDKPDNHLGHFLALEKAFKQLGLTIDKSCKDVSRLRGYSYDPEAYFNHAGKTFFVCLALPSLPTLIRRAGFVNTDPGRDVESCILQIEERGIDITEGYLPWFEIACALANEFGEVGRNYFHRCSQFNPGYSWFKADQQYNQCLRHKYGYGLGSFFHYCKEWNVKPIRQEEKKRSELIELSSGQMFVGATTHTDFGGLILAYVIVNGKYHYDLLFDQGGEPITEGPHIKPLAEFFNKSFIRAKLDGKDCLLNIINAN